MSGGYFEYADRRAKDEIFGYSGDKPKGNVFEDREITELVWDVFNLIHDFDWYQSGDTCKETYLSRKAEFKKKWLAKHPERVKEIIDLAIAEAKQELYETYGIEKTADDEAQTTDAEPVKHAYWEEKQDMNGDTYYHCTNCKEDFALLEGTPKDNLYYYCPYCGAKMDLKEGESE